MRPGAEGQVREHHASLPSTNDRALAWARAGAPHGAMVTADAQSAGRGRLGRRWESPPGEGLYVSLVLRPEAMTGAQVGWSARWASLGLAVGLGLREGLARWVPGAALKWPNDVLVGGEKLAGVLCETRWQGPEPGSGGRLRDQRAAARVPGGAAGDQPRASAARRDMSFAPGGAGGRTVGVGAGAAQLLRRRLPGDPGRVRAHSAVFGRTLRVGGVPAEAVGFDDDGALRVRPTGGGPSRRVEAEDVWLGSGRA
jgi:BirA family biotin operon repressor/biotin-[acetyl-CoA-carboxylase] ligase